MKNIYILPTDQPSRLQLNIYAKKLILFNSIQSQNESVHLSNQYIYITSENEDINENEYVMKRDGELIKVDYLLSEYVKNSNKVILSTNPTLIADGVQAIDDDFLEWFIKNPTCEFIHVYNDRVVGYEYDHYTIIIPHEGIDDELLPKFSNTKPPTYDESIQHILNAHKIPKEFFGQVETRQVRYSPGKYYHRACAYCKISFTGSKRCTICPDCTLKEDRIEFEKTIEKTETLEEASERIINNDSLSYENDYARESFIKGVNFLSDKMMEFIKDQDNHTQGELENSCIDVNSLINFINKFK